MAPKPSTYAKDAKSKHTSLSSKLPKLPPPTTFAILSAQIARQAATIEGLRGEREQAWERGGWGGALLSPTPPLAGDSPRAPVTFELEAAVAGEVVSRVEDEVDEISMDLEQLGYAIGRIPKDPGDEREAAQASAKAQADLLAQRIAAALALARKGKHKIAGAAAASRDFDDVVDHIKEAEFSFKEVSRRLRSERNLADSPDRLDYRLVHLRDAAEWLASDIGHLKEALSALG